MSEVIRESAIKLFGKTIGLMSDYKIVSDITLSEQRQSSSVASTSENKKDSSTDDFTENKREYESINPSQETSTQTTTTSSSDDSEKDSNAPKEDEQTETETSDSQEKTLKKPDKIIPCPRCKSMDTKFCYYNNYNVNQPRYFCKKCQRYWTSGGTMRNVPIGSGRRKNKNAIVPNYRHIMFLDSPQEARPVPTNGFLIFGSEKSQNFVANEFKGFPVAFCPSTTYWRSNLLREENLSSKKMCADRSTLLTPKTLRIDDPNDAAKSSIWSTLGIKNDKIGSTNKTSLFKAFESKGERNRSIDNATMVLQANPAALSRSLNFHENA